jgi:predicted Rossmann fold nucleotide-binding protein DprA/Smf involved in DNA uptake
MSLTERRIGVVGSREFHGWEQLHDTVAKRILSPFDEIVSGGAIGADSMAQRFAGMN